MHQSKRQDVRHTTVETWSAISTTNIPLSQPLADLRETLVSRAHCGLMTPAHILQETTPRQWRFAGLNESLYDTQSVVGTTTSSAVVSWSSSWSYISAKPGRGSRCPPDMPTECHVHVQLHDANAESDCDVMLSGPGPPWKT